MTSNKWGKQKIGRITEGSAVRMEVDMDNYTITWFVSNGTCNIAPITKLFQKLTLVPYF